jgi:hypothetical protein
MILKMAMRRPSSWRRAARLLLVALLSGCYTESSAPTGTTTTADSLATQLANAFCARQLCCGTPTASRDAAVAPGSADAGAVSAGSADAGADGGADAGTGGLACLADAGGSGESAPDAGSSCQARALIAIEQQLALVTTAAAEGLLAITSANAATTCVAAYQNSPCSGRSSSVPDVQQALGGCTGLFTGYIPLGERCDMTAECVAGGYCLSQGTGDNVISLGGSGSLGVCFPYQGAGGPCNRSSDCDPSLGLTCAAVTLTCTKPI